MIVGASACDRATDCRVHRGVNGVAVQREVSDVRGRFCYRDVKRS